MALPSPNTELTEDKSLENWLQIGSGGFGKVYKARHKTWEVDVAIKLPKCGDGHLPHSSFSDEFALWQEAKHMAVAANSYVLRVYGVYKGCPPHAESCVQMGIVMEYMERGSLQSLQDVLSGPPPWPLAFQLAHQVAIGMTFLHKIPVLHKDLKPSNVLLDKDLNAKLADFGLSRGSTGTTGQEGGTLAYMPPEAFNESYQPDPAYDRYSYGMLLWSILTGKEPFQGAKTSHVILWTSDLKRRPSCDEINCQAEGIRKLTDLMQECWDGEPSKRPRFSKCAKVAEEVLSNHKKGIRDAVSQVLLKLDSENNQSPSNTSSFLSQLPAAKDTVDRNSFPKTVGTSKKDSVDVFTEKLSDNDKATFVDAHRAKLIQEISVVMAIADDLGDLVHPEIYARIEAKQTNQDKMRELYKTLRTGGLKVKVAFYNALSKNEPALLERLSG